MLTRLKCLRFYPSSMVHHLFYRNFSGCSHNAHSLYRRRTISDVVNRKNLKYCGRSNSCVSSSIEPDTLQHPLFSVTVLKKLPQFLAFKCIRRLFSLIRERPSLAPYNRSYVSPQYSRTYKEQTTDVGWACGQNE